MENHRYELVQGFLFLFFQKRNQASKEVECLALSGMWNSGRDGVRVGKPCSPTLPPPPPHNSGPLPGGLSWPGLCLH